MSKGILIPSESISWQLHNSQTVSLPAFTRACCLNPHPPTETAWVTYCFCVCACVSVFLCYGYCMCFSLFVMNIKNKSCVSLQGVCVCLVNRQRWKIRGHSKSEARGQGSCLQWHSRTFLSTFIWSSSGPESSFLSWASSSAATSLGKHIPPIYLSTLNTKINATISTFFL